MSVTQLAPEVRRLLADLARRVGILERRITASATTTDTSKELIFSHDGPLTEATSPPLGVWHGGILSVLAVKLRAAGSTDTIIDVYRDGAVVATVTVPAGDASHNGEVGSRYSDDSALALEITTAGTGAAGMTAAARFT